jgi:diacylglycerol kinase (ATP)
LRCVLIYNPVSGTARPQRRQQVEAAARALQHAGNEVEIVATTAAGSASAQTRDAVAAGTDVLFACGGDGTVHEVVQGLVSGGERTASLGIIPMGSENALARHLKLSFDPSEAALQQIRSQARSVPIGKITFGHQMRFFIVMAGAGPDGALVYSLLSGEKARLGS